VRSCWCRTGAGREMALSGAYRVILVGNGSPLHQARDDLGREEVLALAGDRHNAVL